MDSIIMLVLVGLLDSPLPTTTTATSRVPEELAMQLKARQALFENALVEFDHVDWEHESLTGYREPGETWPQRHTYRKTLAARRGDFIVRSVPQNEESPIRQQVWSWSGNRWQDVVFMKDDSSKVNANLAIIDNDAPFYLREGRAHKQLLERCLGFGYGDFLTSVKSITKGKEGTIVEGTCELFGANHPCRLLVDSAGIVRRSEVTVPQANGSRVTSVITAEGSMRIGNTLTAKKGRATSIQRWNEGDQIKEMYVSDRELEIRGCLEGLSDEQFNDLMVLDIPNNSYIWDLNNHHKQYKDSMGRTEMLNRLPASAPESVSTDQFYFWLILVHGILFALAVFLFYRGWRLRGWRRQAT